MKKYLFIGGVADGIRREVQHEDQPQRVGKSTLSMLDEVLTDTNRLTTTKCMIEETYEPHRLQDLLGRKHVVFIRPGDKERVIEMLIEGYKGEPEE